MIGADGQEPGILALRPRVRLHREGVIAGDGAELAAEVADHLRIALGLVGRRERMDVGELRPATAPSSRPSRSASSCRTRAGSSPGRARDRGRRAGACSGSSPPRRGSCGRSDASGTRLSGPASSGSAALVVEVPVEHVAAERPPDRLRMLAPRPLVEARCRCGRADLAQVDPLRHRRLQDHPLQRPDLDGDRVEERLAAPPGTRGSPAPSPAAPSCGGCAARSPSAPPARGRPHTSTPSPPAAPARCRRSRSPSRAGCAARGSAAPAGRRRLPRASIETPTIRPGIDRFSASLHRHVGRVRPAVPERHPEPLGRADGDVRPHLPRRLQERQRQRIGRHAGERPRRVQRRDRPGEVVDMRRRCRDTGRSPRRPRAGVEIGEGIADDHLPAERLGPGADHVDRLRMAVARRRRRRPPSTSPRAGRAPSPPPPPSPRRAGSRSPRRARSGRRPWSGSSAAPRAAPG